MNTYGCAMLLQEHIHRGTHTHSYTYIRTQFNAYKHTKIHIHKYTHMSTYTQNAQRSLLWTSTRVR